MKNLLFFSELGRLLKSRLTWLVMLLVLVSPVAGLVWYKPASAETMLSMYLANPALAGGVAGGILFGLLTLYELDRAGRSRVDVLGVAHAISPKVTVPAPSRRRTVIRKMRMVRLSASFLRSTIAHPPYRFDIISLQLMTEIFDMAVHHTLIHIRIIAPDS